MSGRQKFQWNDVLFYPATGAILVVEWADERGLIMTCSQSAIAHDQWASVHWLHEPANLKLVKVGTL